MGLEGKRPSNAVIPDGVSQSGTSCRKVPQGPRSPLRSGGDDIVLDDFILEAVLVIPLVHQTASSSVIGRCVASSPDFRWKSAAERREADLTRHIAHKQLRLVFGEGRAFTKAF
jgi:hypothetical protein